jgi:hypothetical protein
MARTRCGYALTLFRFVGGLGGGTSVLHSAAIVATGVAGRSGAFRGDSVTMRTTDAGTISSHQTVPRRASLANPDIAAQPEQDFSGNTPPFTARAQAISDRVQGVS